MEKFEMETFVRIRSKINASNIQKCHCEKQDSVLAKESILKELTFDNEKWNWFQFYLLWISKKNKTSMG